MGKRQLRLVAYVVNRNRTRLGEMIGARWPDVTRLKAGPVEINLERVLTEAAKVQSKDGTVVTVSPGASTQIDRRAARLKPLLQRARLLWVDDHSELNRPLQAVLEDWFERDIDVALTTAEALDCMRRRIYDVVVTDL